MLNCTTIQQILDNRKIRHYNQNWVDFKEIFVGESVVYKLKLQRRFSQSLIKKESVNLCGRSYYL